MRTAISPRSATSTHCIQPGTLSFSSGRPAPGELRLALGKEGADALGAFRAHRMRRDGLALEDHLRFQRAERVCHQALGRAVRTARTARQTLGHLERAT